METGPRVSIIILNWNGWKDTIECLESVYQINYPNYDVIVVDNGSENESIGKIKEYAEGKLEVTSDFFKYSRENKPLSHIDYSRDEAKAGGGREAEIDDLPPWKKFILINNGKNYGFAEGNNIAIRYALKALNPGYVLLLNNDTVVDRDFLDELVDVAESDKNIGFVGPKIYYYDYMGENNVINFAGAKINLYTGRSSKKLFNQVDNGNYESISDTDYVEGSCILARTNVICSIGYLNPYFFTYWEDTDWCMRAKRAEYRVLCVLKARMWHKVSASSKGTIKGYYTSRNRLKFLREYATRIQLIFFYVYFFGLEFWVCCGKLLFVIRDKNACISYIRGVIDGCK